MSNNRILAGRDSNLQIGLNSVRGTGPGWGVPSRAVVRLPFSSESFKAGVTYKEATALVGAKTVQKMDIMSMKAEGGFTTHLEPSIASLLAFLILGRELPVTNPATGVYRHTFVPIPSGRQSSMPGFTAEVDRIMEILRYPSNKVDSASFKCAPEDYLYLDITCAGHSEEQDKVLKKSLATHSAGSASTFNFGAGVIERDDDHIGQFVYVPGTENWYRISDSTTAGLVTVDAPTVIAADYAADVPLEIREVGLTPGLSVSDNEYYRFLDGLLELGLNRDAYETSGSGANGDTIPNVPVEVTGGVNHDLYVSAVCSDPDTGLSRRRVFKYIGAAIARTGTTLTFNLPYVAGPDVIPGISDVDGDANWECQSQIEGGITNVDVSLSNSLKTGDFALNRSPYQLEVQPQSRSFTFTVNAKYEDRFVELRQHIYAPEDLIGRKVSLKLEFESAEYITGTTAKHKLIVYAPNCYITSADPNIGGPDEPEVSFEATATEQGGLEAVYIIVEDGTNALVVDTFAPVAV